MNKNLGTAAKQTLVRQFGRFGGSEDVMHEGFGFGLWILEMISRTSVVKVSVPEGTLTLYFTNCSNQ